MKKISLVLPNLIGGGAERLALYLADDWIKHGFSVEIVLMERSGELIPLVNPKVKIIDLGAKRIRNVIPLLYKYIKSARPNVILVGMWPLTSVSIVAWLLTKKVGNMYVIDHNQLSESVLNELNFSAFYLKYIMKFTYPFSSGIMAVSHGVKKDLCRLAGINEKNIKVIYNPAATGVPSNIKVSNDEKKCLWGSGLQYNILTVGSLNKQKNHELLIRAFFKISTKLNAKLIILGEGRERTNLENLILKLELGDRVDLAGFNSNPYPWYLTADLFVLSSNWEGLPTVLIEALECGLPIVSTNCPSGPDEILENGSYGKLVPMNNINALSDAIESSLMESHDPLPLTKRAKDFTILNISRKYLEYFKLIDKEVEV